MHFAQALDSEARSLRDELATFGSVLAATRNPPIRNANLWLYEFESSLASDRREVIAALLSSRNFSHNAHVQAASNAIHWFPYSPEASRECMVSLLVEGVVDEQATFAGDIRAATAFVSRVIAWVGAPFAAFADTKVHPDSANRYGFSFLSSDFAASWTVALIREPRIALLCCIDHSAKK